MGEVNKASPRSNNRLAIGRAGVHGQEINGEGGDGGGLALLRAVIMDGVVRKTYLTTSCSRVVIVTLRVRSIIV